MRKLIKNGTVVNPAGESGALDILVENGIIFAMEQNISEKIVDVDEVIDAEGLTVAPGLVDVHVHFRDPGQTQKEDILSGAEAAKAGGFTTVVMMANTAPPIDDVNTLKYVLEKGATTGIKVQSCATITHGMKGDVMVDMGELVRAGAVGFTDDGKPILDENVARSAMKKAASLGVPVSFHEEDPTYVITPGFNKGEASTYFDIGGADRQAEITMIARDVRLAQETGATIDIQHISTKEGVAILRKAIKEQKANNIHAEATPHHFSLTEWDAMQHGVLAKMNPPLRTESDRKAIIEGLRDGTIDMIVTDHAPHTAEEKASGLLTAPSGIIGLETSLGLGITELVRKEGFPIELLIARMSYGPAVVYGLDAGVLRPGSPADIVIFDESEVWTVPEHFKSKATNSPFIGQKLYGKVKWTICDGEVVYQDKIK